MPSRFHRPATPCSRSPWTRKSRTGSPGGRLVFAGLLFYAINAMVSGDLNDNRPLFMFLGSAFLGLDLRPEEAT